MKGLVEQKEWELEAEAMGIKVTDQEIETQLDELKQQYGLTDEQKYQAELAKAGITDAQVRDQLRTRILTNKIYEAVTKKVTVTDADIEAYYDKNTTKYQQPASREVRHILVKNEALAQKLHDQIQGGADFAKLAKKYTQDTASKADGGKFTAFKGRTVAPFDEFVFSAKTGELSDPIKTEFGWHIIEALGPDQARDDATARRRQGRDPDDASADEAERGHEGLDRGAASEVRATRSPTLPAMPRRARPTPAAEPPPPVSVVPDRDELARALVDLQELAERLRRDCPWDRAQTAETIVPHTVEEAYEVADAALAADDAKLVDELGDLLFQTFFLALLLEERGAGDLATVARRFTRSSCAAIRMSSGTARRTPRARSSSAGRS